MQKQMIFYHFPIPEAPKLMSMLILGCPCLIKNKFLSIGHTYKQKSHGKWLIGIYFRARPKKRSLEEEQINVPGLEEVIKTTVLIVFYSVPEPLCFSVPVFVVPDQNPISDQTTWPPDQNPCAFTDQCRSDRLSFSLPDSINCTVPDQNPCTDNLFCYCNCTATWLCWSQGLEREQWSPSWWTRADTRGCAGQS